MPLRRPVFWLALLALMLVLLGLAAIALPNALSGPVVWSFDKSHGLRLADVIGMALAAAGSVLTWIISLIWQWRCAR